MLHELVFALYGCPGGIFIETEYGIKVSKSITVLHESEVAILNKLCILGTEFCLFQNFIREHDGLRASQKGKVCSMYLRAFCNGLDQVLSAYRKDLVTIEKNILDDPQISLFNIQHILEKYFPLFQALKELINQIKQKLLHGCKILSLVCCQSGIPIVSEAYNKILQTCHKPLLKQLIGWMIYGRLFDPYEEFFIQKVKPKEMSDFEKATTEKLSHEASHGSFEINTDLLPSYLTIEVATKILFVGSSVCLFGKNQQGLSLTTSMFADKENYFSKAINNLQDGEFSIIQFKSVIDEIRACTSEHLWKIVVDDGELLSHLHCLKDFYLLGRGELFLTFIDQGGHYLDVPPNETTEWEINRAFQAASSSVLLADDNISEKFSLSIKLSSKNETFRKESTNNGWSCVGLNYDVKWPLHAILNPLVLEKYNKVFRFLLSIRQVQKELHHCWLIKMKSEKAAKPYQNDLWELLTNLTFFIDNLQYYLQNDVLESQFAHLVDVVKNKEDFEAIVHAHETFISTVTSLSFLRWIPVHGSLLEIMSLSRQLCKTICAIKDGAQIEGKTIEELSKGVYRATSFVYHNLSSAHDRQEHVNLGMLLLKLDFNKYFSTFRHLSTTKA